MLLECSPARSWPAPGPPSKGAARAQGAAWCSTPAVRRGSPLLVSPASICVPSCLPGLQAPPEQRGSPSAGPSPVRTVHPASFSRRDPFSTASPERLPSAALAAGRAARDSGSHAVHLPRGSHCAHPRVRAPGPGGPPGHRSSLGCGTAAVGGRRRVGLLRQRRGCHAAQAFWAASGESRLGTAAGSRGLSETGGAAAHKHIRRMAIGSFQAAVRAVLSCAALCCTVLRCAAGIQGVEALSIAQRQPPPKPSRSSSNSTNSSAVAAANLTDAAAGAAGGGTGAQQAWQPWHLERVRQPPPGANLSALPDGSGTHVYIISSVSCLLLVARTRGVYGRRGEVQGEVRRSSCTLRPALPANHAAPAAARSPKRCCAMPCSITSPRAVHVLCCRVCSGSTRSLPSRPGRPAAGRWGTGGMAD